MRLKGFETIDLQNLIRQVPGYKEGSAASSWPSGTFGTFGVPVVVDREHLGAQRRAHAVTTTPAGAAGRTTDLGLQLYRWEMAGPPSGPAPHFHRSITESFYVLSGTVGLYDGSD